MPFGKAGKFTIKMNIWNCKTLTVQGRQLLNSGDCLHRFHCTASLDFCLWQLYALK